MFNRTISHLYIGTTLNGGATISWENHSREEIDIENALGKMYYSQNLVSRTMNITKEWKAGDFVYCRLLEWSGDSYDFVSVIGVKNDVSTLIGRIYGDTSNYIELYLDQDYDTLRFIVGTESTPVVKTFMKMMVCRMDELPNLAMLERSPYKGKYLSII